MSTDDFDPYAQAHLFITLTLLGHIARMAPDPEVLLEEFRQSVARQIDGSDDWNVSDQEAAERRRETQEAARLLLSTISLRPPKLPGA